MKKRILSTFMAAVFGILSVGMVNVSVMAATKNIIDIELALDDASELTWVASDAVTVSNADGIGGRDNVIKAEGLSNSNNNTVGVKLPDGFSFEEGYTLTYSLDIYSESTLNPDIWLRNHSTGLEPFVTFYHEAVTTNAWNQITGTFTYDEMVEKSIQQGGKGTFDTTGNYAIYIRPRSSATVYLDNFKVTVSKEIEVQRKNVISIDLPLDAASELTWIASDAVTVSATSGIGGRDNVIKAEGLSNSNNNTVGVKLPDGFAFQAGDILTYSLDVYSESAINPDMWLRDHADLVPFVTLYHGTVTTGTWAQITGTFTYDELVQKSIDCGSTGAFDTAGNYAFYIRPRSSATVYLDNFKVTVSREEEPIECEHTYGDWKSIDSVNHSRTCSLCGTVITKAHSWNSGTVTTEPTTTTTGIKTYKCVSCNYTKTEILDKLVAPSERTTITVGNANSCAGNEVTVPVSISKNTGLTGLSLLIGYDSDALTLIGATKGTALSSLTFTRGQIDANTAILIWDGDAQDSTNGQIVQLVFRVDETASDEYTIEATVKAACDGNSNKVYTNVSAGTVTLKAHSYGSWVENDEETHKKVCAYGHFITESHDWDAGVITTSATCTKEGVKTYTCTVCGYTKTETIPKDAEAHSYGNWVANGEKVHKKTCSCGLYITESHTWDEGVITTQPTTTTAGIKTYECTACLYTKTESFGTRLPTTSDTTVIVGSVTASTGNEITVPVSISNNVGITGLQLTLEYNTNVLTLTGVTRSTALATMEFTQPGDLNQNSLLFMWDGQDADSSNGEILLLTFKVADSAVAGEYQILVDSAIACDQNMNDAPVYLTGGTVSVVTQAPGDVNNDKKVDVRDVMLLRRYVTGGYGVVLNESVANVNKDSRVDVRDVMLLRRYVTGGYGVVLK